MGLGYTKTSEMSVPGRLTVKGESWWSELRVARFAYNRKIMASAATAMALTTMREFFKSSPRLPPNYANGSLLNRILNKYVFGRLNRKFKVRFDLRSISVCQSVPADCSPNGPKLLGDLMVAKALEKHSQRMFDYHRS